VSGGADGALASARREGRTIRYATAKDRVRAIIGALQDSCRAAGGSQDKETG